MGRIFIAKFNARQGISTTHGSTVQQSGAAGPSSVDQTPARWGTQADDYGRDFGAVYDRVFPIDDQAHAAADRLLGIGTEVTTAALDDALVTPRPTTTPAARGRGSFAEFGVGSGRVALLLAAAGSAVIGIDRSPELLGAAERRAGEIVGGRIDLVRADIRDWVAPAPVDVAYCICATLSMIQDDADHRQVLRNMRRSIGSGGRVVIETHSPDRVRRMHQDSRVVEFDTVVPGLPGGLLSRSVLADDARSWSVQHTWRDPGPASATEFSRLIDPYRLVALAAAEGLELVALESGWASEAHDSLSPTYVCVFRPVTAGASAPHTPSGRPRPVPTGRTP